MNLLENIYLIHHSQQRVHYMLLDHDSNSRGLLKLMLKIGPSIGAN